MPNYSAMDDARLKIELGTHGLRPMGRKRAVAKLIEIYESVHPRKFCYPFFDIPIRSLNYFDRSEKLLIINIRAKEERCYYFRLLHKNKHLGPLLPSMTHYLFDEKRLKLVYDCESC